jgi:hypothetical protein
VCVCVCTVIQFRASVTSIHAEKKRNRAVKNGKEEAQ